MSWKHRQKWPICRVKIGQNWPFWAEIFDLFWKNGKMARSSDVYFLATIVRNHSSTISILRGAWSVKFSTIFYPKTTKMWSKTAIFGLFWPKIRSFLTTLLGDFLVQVSFSTRIMRWILYMCTGLLYGVYRGDRTPYESYLLSLLMWFVNFFTIVH